MQIALCFLNVSNLYVREITFTFLGHPERCVL